MGNGSPGDHWYSDVVVHGVPTLSAEADRLVIAIRALAGEHASSEPVTSLVDAHLARARQRRGRGGRSTAFIEHHLEPAELEALEHDLRAMCSELPPGPAGTGALRTRPPLRPGTANPKPG